MRKRVRTCSERSSIAPRFVTGSVWARYFIASTSNRCPSTYRGSVVRSRRFRFRSGATGMVKTFAMRMIVPQKTLGQYSVPCNVFQPESVSCAV